MALICCYRNNFLRVWVLRVCQQSEKHLDKILNVDEFVRRIFSVIHSNDPVSKDINVLKCGSCANTVSTNTLLNFLSFLTGC